MNRQAMADQLLKEAIQEETSATFIRSESWIQDGNLWTSKCHFLDEEGQSDISFFVVVFEPNSDKVLKAELGEY